MLIYALGKTVGYVIKYMLGGGIGILRPPHRGSSHAHYKSAKSAY